jgi:hypothetical protein
LNLSTIHSDFWGISCLCTDEIANIQELR